MKKKFSFEYEKLLEFRHQQEKVVRKDYLESLGSLEKEKVSYKKMHADFEDAQASVYETQQAASGMELPKLEQLDQYMAGQKIRIGRQRDVVMNYQQIVEQKQEILIAATKERKILEKLKEKRQVEYKKMLNKDELKKVDELVVTRFKKG